MMELNTLSARAALLNTTDCTVVLAVEASTISTAKGGEISATQSSTSESGEKGRDGWPALEIRGG